MDALNSSEETLQSLLASTSLTDQKRRALQSCLESLRACRVLLCEYADIDDCDREAVEHFNTFQSWRDIPAAEKDAYMSLDCKYTSQGMESEIPGFGAMVDSLK